MSIVYSDLINKPFTDQGRGPDGYDCWGLVKEVYKRNGIELPDYTISAKACEEISQQIIESRPDWEQIQIAETPCLVVLKGDLYFVQHLGVHVGFKKFIHASEQGVCIDRLNSPQWKTKFRGFYRYVGK